MSTDPRTPESLHGSSDAVVEFRPWAGSQSADGEGPADQDGIPEDFAARVAVIVKADDADKDKVYSGLLWVLFTGLALATIGFIVLLFAT